MLNEVYKETKDNMDKALKALEREFTRVRTGRASATLLDGVRVDYYGAPTPLNQVASVSVPEARLILIQPWDISALAGIEKAILKSELGLNPANDGKVLRITIPPLTQERRKELVKVVGKMAEEAKVAVRNCRRDANDVIKDLKKEKEITEDESFKAQDEVQAITDVYVKKVDEMAEQKEKEILEF